MIGDANDNGVNGETVEPGSDNVPTPPAPEDVDPSASKLRRSVRPFNLLPTSSSR